MATLDEIDEGQLECFMSKIRQTKVKSEQHGTRARVNDFNKAIVAYQQWYGQGHNWRQDLAEFILEENWRRKYQ
jgi:hypothetical protein